MKALMAPEMTKWIKREECGRAIFCLQPFKFDHNGSNAHIKHIKRNFKIWCTPRGQDRQNPTPDFESPDRRG